MTDLVTRLREGIAIAKAANTQQSRQMADIFTEVVERIAELEIERDYYREQYLDANAECKQWREDAERWRKACQILESETGDIELRIWTDNGDAEINGAWNSPSTKAEADEAIDAARKGEGE